MTFRTRQTVVLAKIIRACMTDQNRSTLSLAVEVGMNESTLRRRLRADGSFTTDELNAVAVALGTSGSALLAEAEGVAAA